MRRCDVQVEDCERPFGVWANEANPRPAAAAIALVALLLAAVTVLACGTENGVDQSALAPIELVCDTPARAPSSEDLMRYPDLHFGKCYVFSGVVMDVNVFSSGPFTGWNEVWIATGPPRPPIHRQWVLVTGPPSCFRSEGRVVVGDHLTVKGQMGSEPYQYESVAMGVLEEPLAVCAE